MKNLICFLIFNTVFFNYIISQATLDCEGEFVTQSLMIGDAECINVSDMDYLQFVVTYSNTYSGIVISELPDGSRYVCSDSGDFTDIENPPGDITLGSSEGECTIRLPGCDPVVLNFRFATTAGDDCEDLDYEISVENNNPIPTLGTWALMILGLLISVFAVVAIRKRSWAMA